MQKSSIGMNHFIQKNFLKLKVIMQEILLVSNLKVKVFIPSSKTLFNWSTNIVNALMFWKSIK